MHHNFYKPPPSLHYSELVALNGVAPPNCGCLPGNVHHGVNKHTAAASYIYEHHVGDWLVRCGNSISHY